jgi:hypothetical protein
MKTIKILSVIILAVSFCYGQSPKKQLKIGTSEYCAGTDYCGKATYQYYFDRATSTEIMHGTYKASGVSKSDYGFSSFSIKGQFIDGYKTGIWTYIKQRKDVQMQSGTFATGLLRSTQNFKNGLPNGKWKLRETTKYRDLLELYGKSVWGHFTEPIIDSASTTFKDGVMVGVTYCKKYGETTGTFNNNGFIVGKYKASNTNAIFNSNGVMLQDNGPVLDTTIIRYANLYLEGKITKSKLEELSIKVDTVKNVLEDMSELFEQPFFTGVNGDKTMDYKAYNRIYGRCFKFYK